MLSEKNVDKYQEIHKNLFGNEISREMAYERGAKLLRIVDLIYRPMTLDEYGQVQKRRKETN